MLDRHEFLYQTHTGAHAPVPLFISHADIRSIVEGPFADFLRLPEDTKKKSFHKLKPPRGHEIGYVRRGADHDLDDKAYFHYHPFADKKFAENKEVACLLDGVRPAYAKAVESFEQSLVLLESEYPGIREIFFPTDGDPLFYFRILAYFGDAMLAKNHLDLSALTLGLAESGPGLHIGWDEGTLKPVEHRDGEAIFMPGVALPDVLGPSGPPSAWHGVRRAKALTDSHTETVAKPDMQDGSLRIERWAVVLFGHPKNPLNYHRDLTNTPHPLSLQRALDLANGWKPRFRSAA